MRVLLLATALLALPAAAASVPSAPTDPTAALSEGGASPFHDGLVWGIGLGSAGVATALGLLFFLGVGGLRHVDRDNVLEHDLRQKLLESIQANPGIHLRELASRHDTAVTNTQWHLRKLELAGLIKTQKLEGRRLYYPAQGGAAVRVRAIENAVMANPNAGRVTEFLAANAGANQATLAANLGMNPGTVRWHLRKLESAGVVRSIQEAHQTRYFLLRVERAVRSVPAVVEPILVQH